jgi:hypothetical protein
MKPCVVSFVDSEGLRHSVEVQAESLYEAAALALKVFCSHDCEPGAGSKLDVEVRSSVTYSVPMKKLMDWLGRRGKGTEGNPPQTATKGTAR